METDADVPEEAGGESGEPCTLLFAGDVYLSEHVLGAYSRAGNITGVLDQGILKEILGADIFMVNQEFRLQTGEQRRQISSLPSVYRRKRCPYSRRWAWIL